MHATRLVISLLAFASLASSTPAFAGGPLTSAVTESGSLTGPSYTESWTFSGTTGERVLILAVTTSGAVNTVIKLKSPLGVDLINTAADRVDHLFTSTGTYTIEISDQGLNDAGAYAISIYNLTSGPLTHAGDLDGGGLASGEVGSGTIGVATDIDVFTFSGTAGQRVLFGVLEGTVAPFNVTISLYPPGGGPSEVSLGGGNRIDHQLAGSGTYTVVVEDLGNDHTGSYTVSHLNVSGGPHSTIADPDGGAIVSATQASGTLNGVLDWDAFTFSGAVGDRIVGVSLTTSGAMNTTTYLYPPGGGAPLIATGADRWEFQLTQAGVHTLVIEDQLFGETGNYTVSLLNLTSGPLTHAGDLDGGSLASGEDRAGTAGVVTDLDAFTFPGIVGQRVLFGVLEGTASPFNIILTLYPPGGGPGEVNTGGSNRIDHQLAATGTYTVVVEDIGNDNTGSYTVSHLNVSGGPHTTVADPDGGTIVSATQASGTMNSVLDWDAFTFSGAANDRVIGVSLTTGGTLNTMAYLYPPNGGAPQIATAADRWEFKLTQTGLHTVVIEDQNFGETGTYTLSLLNLSGPLTQAGDLDGGGIASGEVVPASMGVVTDLDAFTFPGTAGQRVLFGVLEGNVAPFNVTLTLYPPGGGPAEVTTSGNNRIDQQLAATGTYTVLVEDILNDHTGSYTVSHLNVSGGPHSTVADPDGGAIASGAQASGTMNGVLDWDAFTFSGAIGDRIIGVSLATSGAMNTNTYLYPPNGGAAQVATAADRWEFQLTQAGVHTLVIEDQAFGETGTYTASLLNLSGPLTHAGDLDGDAMASAETRAGTVGVVTDLDAFKFTALAGDRIVASSVATSGASFNTTMTLYPPGGGTSVVSTGGGDRLDTQVGTAGTYTLVVEDVTDSHTGGYGLSLVDVTSGPYYSAGDIDGGAMFSGQVRTGNISPVPDLDVYWFNAQPGDTAIVNCFTTSGALNTNTYLYPPGGGAAVVNTSNDNWTHTIAATGRYALLVQHFGLTQTGGYQLGLSGPLTTVDVPGPSPQPARLALSSARPNPSGADAAFTLDLPRPSRVEVKVYDLKGALVRTLEDRAIEPGSHTLTWNGRDERGRRVASGVYLIRVQANDQLFTRRVVRVN